MGSPVKGIGVVLRAKRAGIYIPVSCATSLDFTCDTELIRKTSIGSAGYVEFATRLCEWGFTLNSVTHIQKDGYYTVFDMLIETLRREGLDIEAVYPDDDGNIKTLTGHVLIPSISITSPVVGFSENSIEFKGTGPFELATELISPEEIETEVRKYEYTASGGETTIGDAVLIGRNILTVFRDGIDREIITAGTPNDKQVKYIPTSGTFVFSTELGPTEFIKILYQ